MRYTYKDAIYLVLDQLKQSTDDIQLEEDHIAALINASRATLLKQRLGNNKVEIPKEVIQTIPFKLQLINQTITSDREFELLNLNGNHLYYDIVLPDYPNYEISFITLDRFKYVHNNKWLKNIIYSALSNTGKILIKAPDSIKNLFISPSYRINAVFNGILDDPRSVFPFEDNYLDLDLAVNGDLLRVIIDLTVADLLKHMSIPEDIINNGKNDQQFK